MVGGTKTATYTSAAGVEQQLPCGGGNGALTNSIVIPPKVSNTGAGNFLGQVTALKLNVALDLYDPAFSASSIALGALKVGPGSPYPAFAGMTVAAVLTECNTALGGGTAAHTISALATIANAINVNFVGGAVVDSTLLVYP
ncbi:MAG TPA: hypothetical protein VF398_08590 [bacterium]